jgi:hypothetical protein
MPIYPTDRTDIVLEFRDDDIATNYADKIYNGLASDDADYPSGTGAVEIHFPWYDPIAGTGFARFSFERLFPYADSGPIPPIGSGPVGYRLSSFAGLVAGPGCPGVGVRHTEDSGTLAVNASHSFSATLAGTLSFSVLGDEYAGIDYLDATEAVYFDGTPFPITGGNAMPDSIPARKMELFFAPRPGATINVTVSVGGSSVSESFVWEEGLPWYHGLAYVMQAIAGGGFTATCAATPVVQDVTLFAQADHHHTEGPATYDADGSLSMTVGSASDDFHTAAMLADAEIPTVYRYVASLVGADGAAYPDAVSVSYPGGSQSVTGSRTWDVEQKSWIVQDVLDDSLVQTDGVTDEKGWMTAALGGLQTARLDRRDWRLLFRTYQIPGISISHEAVFNILPAGYEGWSGGTAGGIGYLPDTGTAVCTLAVDGSTDRRIWSGYRYAEFNVKAPAGKEITFTLANGDISKTYKATTTGSTAAYLRIDTASPTNLPSGVGDTWDRDNRYPLRPQANHADSPIASQPDDDAGYLDVALDPSQDATDSDAIERVRTWVWGANDVETLTVSCSLDDGETLEIGAVRLVRVGAPKSTLSESFKGQSVVTEDALDALKLWPITAGGGRTTEVARAWGGPFAYVVVDGRLVCDFAGSWYRIYEAGGPEWVYPSVSDLCGWYNSIPGLSAVDAAPTANFFGYTTSSALALELGGNGTTFAGTTATHHVDRAPGDVPAQFLLDWFQGWPGGADGSGGEWDASTDIGGPWALRVGKHLGARSQGFAFQNDESPNPGEPLTGQTVENRRTDTADDETTTDVLFGQATTQTDGSYSTDVKHGPAGRTPGPYDGFAGGGISDLTRLLSGSNPEETQRFRARQIKRTSYRSVRLERGKILAFLSRGDGRLFRVVDKTGTAWLGASSAPTYSTWDDRDLTEPATEASLQRGRGERIISGLLASGSVTARIEASEGRTAPITTMDYGPATSHDLARYGDGTHVCARIDGGAVKLSVHNDLDLSLVAGPFTTNVTGLPDDATVRADDARQSGNVKTLIVLIGSGGDTTAYKTIDLHTLTS